MTERLFPEHQRMVAKFIANYKEKHGIELEFVEVLHIDVLDKTEPGNK